MGGDGDESEGEGGGGGEHGNEFWGLDYGVSVGEYGEDDVEQEPELEHDVSRSTH